MFSKILTKKSPQSGSEEQLEKLKKVLQEPDCPHRPDLSITGSVSGSIFTILPIVVTSIHEM